MSAITRLVTTLALRAREAMATALSWAGVAALATVAAAISAVLARMWPQAVGGFVVGAAVATVVAMRARAAAELSVEGLAIRKDIAVDTAMGIAFSAQELEQRVSGEHPALELYDQEHEAPMCSWCEAIATTRIDLPAHGMENVPVCDSCVEAVRFGDVDPAEALVDQAAINYGSRLG